jgi:hypothetical protein
MHIRKVLHVTDGRISWLSSGGSAAAILYLLEVAFYAYEAREEFAREQL